MTEQEWKALSEAVTDRMKEFTRPYVTILASKPGDRRNEIGTGTFIEQDGVKLLTCEHVSRFDPTGHFLDDGGTITFEPGPWCVDERATVDIGLSAISANAWKPLASRARALPLAKFAARHAPVERELLFLRGIAGENAYVAEIGIDAVLTGYCSQEKLDSGTERIFEMLWNPAEAQVTNGTDAAARARVKKENPAGFSGSLVWNTRFVETGCDLTRWAPELAIVTGLLRRYDVTLLALRGEHLMEFLSV